MATSHQIAEVALWMMVGGGIVAVFALAANFLSGGVTGRSGLAKPLLLVAIGIFLLGAFLYSK